MGQEKITVTKSIATKNYNINELQLKLSNKSVFRKNCNSDLVKQSEWENLREGIGKERGKLIY